MMSQAVILLYVCCCVALLYALNIIQQGLQSTAVMLTNRYAHSVSLLRTAPTVQVSDTTGDATKYHSRLTNKTLR